jgi:hypothetical protein
MLEILTPLSKLHRVSRSVDSSTFIAVPGMWGELQHDGMLINIVTNVPAKINKLIINSSSNNAYESNDVEVGRVSTIEDIGVRCFVDNNGFTGDPAVGELLAVSDKAGAEGLLFSIDEQPNGEFGDYEIVAVVEEKDSVAGTIVYRTLSPEIKTLIAPITTP